MNNESNSSNNSFKRRKVVESVAGGAEEEADEEIRGRVAEEGEQESDNVSFDENENSMWRDDGDENQGREVEQVRDTISAPARRENEENEKLRKFVECCNLLECNHPSICSVEICPSTVPKGYLRQICNAMLGNTRITELELNVIIMFNRSYDLQCASSLIEFVRTSTTLRKVRVIEYGGTKNTDEMVRLMFQAIAINKSIQELRISGSFCNDALNTLLSTSTSLKVLDINCEKLNRITMSHRDHFLRALTSNRSIFNLSLTISEKGWVWLEEIPSRMGNGPSTLQSLWVASETFPPHFYNLLSTTSTLQKLGLECPAWNQFTAEDQNRLLRALADNTSIEHLMLNAWSDRQDGTTMNHILRHLRNGSFSLRKLSLMSYENDLDALHEYLCSSSTANLQHLDLADCDLYVDSVECLVDGFRVLDSRASTRARLELDSCRLSEAAARRFIKFISDRNQRNPHIRDNLPQSVLTLIPELDCVDMLYPAPKLQHDPYDLYEMLHLMEISMSMTVSLPPSVGSAACCTSGDLPTLLSMRPNGNVPAFSDAWVTSTGMLSSLVCLQLWKVGPSDSTKLALWLSRTVSLRAMHLVDIRNDVVPKIILNGLRQNGSLLSTTFTKGLHNQPFFQDTRDRTIIQSYCQRNRFLLEIILNKKAFSKVPVAALEIGVTDHDTNSNTVNNGANNNNNNPLALVPKLFYAADAIPRSRSWFNLAALLALESAIGPQG